MHGALQTVAQTPILLSQRLRLMRNSSLVRFINRAIDTSIRGLMTKGLSSRRQFALLRDLSPRMRQKMTHARETLRGTCDLFTGSGDPLPHARQQMTRACENVARAWDLLPDSGDLLPQARQRMTRAYH